MGIYQTLRLKSAPFTLRPIRLVKAEILNVWRNTSIPVAFYPWWLISRIALSTGPSSSLGPGVTRVCLVESQ